MESHNRGGVKRQTGVRRPSSAVLYWLFLRPVLLYHTKPGQGPCTYYWGGRSTSSWVGPHSNRDPRGRGPPKPKGVRILDWVGPWAPDRAKWPASGSAIRAGGAIAPQTPKGFKRRDAAAPIKSGPPPEGAKVRIAPGAARQGDEIAPKWVRKPRMGLDPRWDQPPDFIGGEKGSPQGKIKAKQPPTNEDQTTKGGGRLPHLFLMGRCKRPHCLTPKWLIGK